MYPQYNGLISLGFNSLFLPVFHVFLGPKVKELGPRLGWCRSFSPFLVVKGEDSRVEDELVGGGHDLKGCVGIFSAEAYLTVSVVCSKRLSMGRMGSYGVFIALSLRAKSFGVILS